MQRFTVNISFYGAKAAGIINWQKHWSCSVDESLEAEGEERENEKLWKVHSWGQGTLSWAFMFSNLTGFSRWRIEKIPSRLGPGVEKSSHGEMHPEHSPQRKLFSEERVFSFPSFNLGGGCFPTWTTSSVCVYPRGINKTKENEWSSQPRDRTPLKNLDLIRRLRDTSRAHPSTTPRGLQTITVGCCGESCKTRSFQYGMLEMA